MTRWRWTLVGVLVGLLGSATLVAQSGIWISVNGGQSLTASTVNPVPAIAIQQNGTGPIFTLKKSDGTTVFEVAADGACTGCGGAGSLPTSVQGDLAYSTAADTWTALHKDTTATRYLSNTGTTNNPAWALVNVANGVTGDLPFANLAQCTALTVLGVTGNSTADNACIAAGSDDFVLRRSGTALAFGTIATGGIANNAVTLAKFATQGAHTILANLTAGSAVPTASSLSAILDDTVGATEHSVIVRGASTWTVTQLENCPDTGSNHLNYVAASHDLTCGTSGGTGGGDVSVSGTPTATHVAVWTNATTIEDGGVLPSFTPTGGIDELIYYAGASDTLFHPLGLANGITLTSGNLGLGDLTLPTGKALRTATSAGNTLLIQAYDVNGTSYTTFGTLTANNTPTFDLDAAVTLGGVAIANASNTIVFTNKTLNCESTGNVCEHPVEYQFTVAASQATVDTLAFNTQTAGAATASHTGTTVIQAFASFADSGTEELQFNVPVPTYWDSAATVEVFGKWRTSATTGDAIWNVSGVCAATAQVVPTAYSSTPDTVTKTAEGTTLRLQDFSITLSTAANHSLATCAAGEQLYLRFFRDPAGSDTIGQAAELASLGIRFRVTK